MDPLDVLAQLVAPLEPGGSIGGWTLREQTDEHGLRMTFERGGGATRLHVELDPRDDRLRSAATTARFALSYRGAGGIVSSAEGRALAQALARLVASNEHAVLAALSARSPDAPGEARVREVPARGALSRAGEGQDAFDTVSPYVGCLVGCRFCYAQERLHRLRAMLGLPDAPWGSWVDVRAGLPEVLRAELAAPEAPLPVKLCPIVSDPYHAVEARSRLTRRVLEVLREDGRRDVLVLTRSALVRDDLDLLASMRAWLGFSVPTLDEGVRARLEPRSATIAERLAILAEARARGVPTFAVVQPVFERDVERLADALATVCGSVRVDVLRGAYGAEEALAEPGLAELAREDVQRELSAALAAALEARGVEVWPGELPRALAEPDSGVAYLEALLAPASPALARARRVLRAAVASGALPAHLVEPSFALEGPRRVRFGVNAASRRRDPARAATTCALLAALDVPSELVSFAERMLAEPAHEVFVAVADEEVPRTKLYLRGPEALLREALRCEAVARLGARSLPDGARTLALDVAGGRVVGLRSYEPLASSDPRVRELAALAAAPPTLPQARAHLARRLDGERAGEEIAHLQVEAAGSLAPAARLAAHVAPGRAPPWAALAARFPLHARVLARSSRGAHTVYLALDSGAGVGSGSHLARKEDER